MSVKCDWCGKRIVWGSRPDGLPNGVTFVCKDGSTVTMCADCLIEEGRKCEAREEARRIAGEPPALREEGGMG